MALLGLDHQGTGYHRRIRTLLVLHPKQGLPWKLETRALLRRALLAASEWSHETFTAQTGPANPVVYQRMSRLGAGSLGQFYQMVRDPPS